MAPFSVPSPWAEVHLAWPWRPLYPASSSGWRTLAATRFQNCSLCDVIDFVSRRDFGRALQSLVAARGHDLARGGPLRDVLPVDRGGHQFWKQIGSAGEGRYAEPGERRGDAMVITRRAVVVEREQRDELDSGAGQCGGALEHLLLIAAFIKIADQDQDCVVRLPDQALAIAERG